MSHIFISHAGADDVFVRQLRLALEALNLPVWVDSRNLRGGSKLRPEIEEAIAAARQVIAVLSLQTVNSPWVRREINHALEIEQKRGADGYRVIPLLLPGMTPAALGNWFDEEPVAVPIALTTGALSEALPALLAALGERLPTDPASPNGGVVQPVDELILELRDPQMVTQAGQRRARATATLVFQPADPAQRPIESRAFLFNAPLGPLELEEMRWYLEEYFRWPIGVFRQRAQATEQALPGWGQALYSAGLGANAAADALNGWRNRGSNAPRRVSLKVERELPEGADPHLQQEADEAASHLLTLPWELLHDEGGYLLHGRYASHIRRQLPNRKPQSRQLATLPVRVLLLSPRPERDDKGNAIGYFDHRSSALPLVQAVENLGELVTLTVLTPPTLAALEAELVEATRINQPYAVIHFDGHGVYDRRQGLGALCFERPPVTVAGQVTAPSPTLDLVYAKHLAALVRNYGIPLVFLDACQSAQVESDPSASVAAALLAEGVTSVVAMRHTVLVATAQRFVQAFYRSLAGGGTVGEALLAGQQALKADPARGKVMGAGELRLHDWFVPVLYQDQPDPQLFAQLPSQAATRLLEQRRTLALGALPATPTHTFVGRSHELLQLERLLATQPYAVIRGSGGMGKTTIAVELARWLLRTHRTRRVAFVSLEERRDAPAVLDSLGHQLLPDGDKYSVAQYPDLKTALQPVERALADQPTVIVIDNVESVLPLPDPTAIEVRNSQPLPSPPKLGEGTVADVSETGEEIAGRTTAPPPSWGRLGGGSADAEIFALCQSLLAASPTTRLIFTSREHLPEPFAAGAARVELGALRQEEAVQLVERVLTTEGKPPPAGDAGDTPQAVAELVDAVGCHARALVLLAREVARQGVRATSATVQRLMAELEAKHLGNRENSLYASVELSLRRLSPAVREKVQCLAVFQGGGRLECLAHVMEVDNDTARAIALALIEVGLADDMGYGYLRLDPALQTYLCIQLSVDEITMLAENWVIAMVSLVHFLYKQKFLDTQMQAHLTLLELPNLLALLAWLPLHMPTEMVVDVAGLIEQLLADLGRSQALAQAVHVREQAAQTLNEWSHAHFEAKRLHIERLLDGGNLHAAYTAAEQLYQRTLAAGETAYSFAAYDIAYIHWLLGRVLNRGGQAEVALAQLVEALRCFESLAVAGDDDAARMASIAMTECADCLLSLGQLDEAAAAYEEAIALAKKRRDLRDVAFAKGNLGTVRLMQERYTDALAAYTDALTYFDRLGDPAKLAWIWHQIGIVYREAEQFEAAERAYRQALALWVQHKLQGGEATSLLELGNLYSDMGRLEEAVAFHRQAVDCYVVLGDQANESRTRSNLAATLFEMGQMDEARRETMRTIEYNKLFGHAVEPWKTWNILHHIERARGEGVAAQVAWQQARTSYLAYRRDGGDAQGGDGRLGDAIWQAWQSDDATDVEQMAETLAEFITSPDVPEWWRTLAAKFQAILAGARDPALADDPALDFSNAAEVLWLIERLRGNTTAD